MFPPSTRMMRTAATAVKMLQTGHWTNSVLTTATTQLVNGISLTMSTDSCIIPNTVNVIRTI